MQNIFVVDVPIGKFLGDSPLTAIAHPSPLTEADGVERLFCELDTSPKWYVNLYRSLKRSCLVDRSTEASCKRPCIAFMLSAPFKERQP